MTLTTRLLVFFLAALAAVLAGFSGAAYVLAQTYLFRQLNDRAAAALDTLAAVAEVEPDGLEWEPKNRPFLLRDGGPPAWAVYDEASRRLDGTPDPARPLDEFAPAAPDGRVNVTWGGDHWRVFRRTLRHPHPEAVRGAPGRHRVLVLVTAWPVAPVHDLVGKLARGLAGVSAAAFVLAAVGGRRACRLALAPVRRMTAAAAGITADDPGERLPVPPARDELRDLAGAFNGVLARLGESAERQRRFAGEASHQLRTPLAAMLGQMEVALRRDRDGSEYRRALAAAVAQAERLAGVVEAMLFLARADADAGLPGLEALDLAAWLGDYLAGHPHGRAGDVRLAAPPAGVRVRAQPAMLAQVVGNLVDNACKYSDPGSPVVVRVAAEGGEAALTVEDSGHGIDPADLGRVFEPFFRTADARRRGVGGLGLGLAVAARVVRAFGGRIEARSEPGRGSTFSVRLPAID